MNCLYGKSLLLRYFCVSPEFVWTGKTAVRGQKSIAICYIKPRPKNEAFCRQVKR